LFPQRPRAPLTTVASGRTTASLLQRRAVDRAEHPFLVWEPFSGDSRRWTYVECARDVAAIGEGLRRAGVGAGDKVLIHLENCPEYVLTWFACAWIGAVAVCTNTRSSLDELSYFGRHSEASVVVTQPSFAELAGRAIPTARAMFITDNDAGRDADAADRPASGERFGRLLDNEPGEPHPADGLDRAQLLYTSGTTGRPKAVIWTHANTMWAAQVNAAASRRGPADVAQVFLPLYHANAQAYSILPALWVGGTAVLQPRFSASQFWDVALRNGCTFASHSNFTVRALANGEVPRRHSFRTWATGVSGHPMEHLFNLRTFGWFGMTETVAATIVGDPLVESKQGTIGHAAPQYGVAVVDANGDPVGIGETGDLRVQGVPGLSLFAGYLHDEAATREAFDDQGWFVTGDLATVHEDGSIAYAGRGKDVLRVGGENVGAVEIERVILGVTGVAEAAVVGAPDPMRDEIPVAFVIVSPQAPPDASIVEQIMTACRTQLADFKVPREVRIVEDLPRSTLEKVAKYELRKTLANESLERR
jgi:crotonobetaine/carnitine-CoA ligase